MYAIETHGRCNKSTGGWLCQHQLVSVTLFRDCFNRQSASQQSRLNCARPKLDLSRPHKHMEAIHAGIAFVKSKPTSVPAQVKYEYDMPDCERDRCDQTSKESREKARTACKSAATRDRTRDLQIFSLTLSQLSYRGTSQFAGCYTGRPPL